MAPPARKLQISQQAFDAAVRENVDDLGMEEEEALADAVETFKLQGVDLSGIITDGNTVEQHPVIQAIQRLVASDAEEDIVKALEMLRLSCTDENVSIAVRNGAMENSVSACKHFVSTANSLSSLCTALKTLDRLLADKQAKAVFDSCGGPEVVVHALLLNDDTGSIPELAGAVIGLAASGNESVKDSFMHLKVEEVLVNLIRSCATSAQVLHGACEALRALVAADDESVLASNAYKNARTIAKAGGVEAILEAASSFAKTDPGLLATICATLRALAVNEEVCKSLAALRGLELVLQIMEQSVKTGNKTLAKNSCSLLGQLAGSDANKEEIVSQGGCETLIAVASCYAEEAQVLQEVMYAIASVTLRSPSNASKAVEAGAIDLAVEAMDRHRQAAGMQKQACQMLRNLAVRNPENRPLILEKGLEKLIREAKRHPSCKDPASAALRDLGLENYNS